MIYAFGDYEVDTVRFEVRHSGVEVAIEPQVFDVLAYLLRHRARVVTKSELLDNVWGDRFVSESALSSRIKAARRTVGDDGTAQRVIKTVHGRGFRFIADVREDGSPAESSAAAQDVASPSAAHRIVAQEVRFHRAADGVRLACATAGDGPPLVKAANWLTHLRRDWESIVWGHWLRDLSARYQLVHYDARGSGMSDWDVDDVSFDAWVGDLEAVVDAGGLDRFSLLGVSQGGAVAVAYAARHPDRVSQLILYGAFAVGRVSRARTAHERREAEMMLDVGESGWGHETSMFQQMFAAQFMPEGTPEQWAAFDAHQRLTASPENARRLLEVSARIDVTDIAPHVRTPTLVLHSTGDRRVPFEQGELLASLIPGARFVALDSRNHLLLDGEPAWSRFLSTVDEFITTSAVQQG
jgi:DNA-binding winged helix-turn-helix (wHTH) protein/pimeloyl-ACP methyl ester carboxylesterase